MAWWITRRCSRPHGCSRDAATRCVAERGRTGRARAGRRSALDGWGAGGVSERASEEVPPEWEDPRRVLARHGLAPKRSFSQNFLVARSAVERIVAALELAPDEPVIELGPGLGKPTAALLRAGAQVVA